MNISIEDMPREIDRLLEENEKLQEDLEYSNHCDEELRKKITNLNYKIKLLEEQHIDTLEQKNKYINTLEQSLNDAEQEIERLNNIINELENYICEIEYDNRLDTIIWTTAVLIHNRLKKLKGSDK